MSYQSLANKPSSQSESLTSESEDEQLGPAQVTSKPNRKTTNQFVAWTFRSNIETDLLSAEGVPVDEKTKLLSEFCPSYLAVSCRLAWGGRRKRGTGAASTIICFGRCPGHG